MERRLFYVRLKFAFLGSLRQDIESTTTTSSWTLTICDHFDSPNFVYQEPLTATKEVIQYVVQEPRTLTTTSHTKEHIIARHIIIIPALQFERFIELDPPPRCRHRRSFLVNLFWRKITFLGCTCCQRPRCSPYLRLI